MTTAAIPQRRGEQAGQGDRGAHRVHHRPLTQPDLAAADQIGGDTGEGLGQSLDALVVELAAEEVHQLAALHQTAAHLEVEQADHGLPVEAAHPVMQAFQLAGGIGRAHQRADRGAADDLRRDAGALERTDHADVRPAARRTAAEGEADAGARRLHRATPGGRGTRRPAAISASSAAALIGLPNR
jgi:hypothetical protein